MTNLTPGDAVVVGVDGSAPSNDALRMAAGLAKREGRRLHLVHAYDPAPPLFRQALLDLDLRDLTRRAIETHARQVLRDARETAFSTSFPAKISTELALADPREALEDTSESAAMVVVGSRGQGLMGRLVLGSVSTWLTQHAHCPVMVVRATGADAGAGVVVGTDLTDLSVPALEFAFSYASLVGAAVTVVHSMPTVFVGGYGLTGAIDPDLDDPAGTRRAVNDSVQGLREKFPDVPVSVEVGRGPATPHLLRNAREAGMLVVGSRRRSAPVAVALGSVSRSVVEHAPCSVVVA